MASPSLPTSPPVDEQHVPDPMADVDPEREAIEFRAISRQPKNLSHNNTNPPSAGSHRGPQNSLLRFWSNNVRISVAHDACRDHLANERTFLAYLRTALGLSFLAIIIAQLFRLQHSTQPNAVLGFYVVGKPLSLAFQSAALVICVTGAARYFKQQHAMSLGKVYAGGWELLLVSGLSGLLLSGLFLIVIGVIAFKEVQDEHAST